MRQRVGMLASCTHALGGVDGEGAAETEEEPSCVLIGEPPPFDLPDAAACITEK